MMKTSLFTLSLIVLLSAIAGAQEHVYFDGGPFYEEVVFEENFAKGRSRLLTTRTITLDSASPVRAFFRNGRGVGSLRRRYAASL